MTYHLQVTNIDLKNRSPLARNAFIKLIGVSMVGLFLPAILWFEYNLGLWQIFLLEALFGFFMMGHLYFWSLRITARMGNVSALFFGIISFTVNFLILYLAKFFPWCIYLSPFFSSLYASLFWTGYHSTMMQGADQDKHFGIHQASIESVSIIAGLLGPLLGGVIADNWGSSYLYLFAVFFLLCSCVPLFFHHRKHIATEYRAPSIKRCRHLLNKQPTRNIFLTFSTIGYIDFVANIIWPIILFSLLNTYTKVAFVSFISTLIVLGILWIIGKKNDGNKQQQQLLEKWIHYSFRGQGSVRLVAGITLIGGFFSQIVFIIIDSFHKITHRANYTYIMTQRYQAQGGEKSIQGTLDMIYFRELAIHSAKGISCILLAVIAYFFQNSLWGLILPLFGVSIFIFVALHVLTRIHGKSSSV